MDGGSKKLLDIINLNYHDQKIWQTMHVTYGQLFQPYQVSLAVYTMISTTGDQTSDHRMQSWNSTTELLVHIAHTQCQIN